MKQVFQLFHTKKGDQLPNPLNLAVTSIRNLQQYPS